MSGAGNDFIIFDARKSELPNKSNLLDNNYKSASSLSSDQIQKISNRKNIGSDQLLILKTPPSPASSDCVMEIYNSDGSVSGACGNATRCVASILIEESGKSEVKIQTLYGILKCWKSSENLISVDMGKPEFFWEKIPLAKEIDAQKVLLHGFEFSCANFGNPHAVTFINESLDEKRFFEIGPKVENDSIFPQKTNVEFAKILSDDLIEVRVWERGVGETLACGSGACAVAVLAIKNGLVKSNKITTRFKGGDLVIEWSEVNSSVTMTGGYQKIFTGVIDEKFFE